MIPELRFRDTRNSEQENHAVYLGWSPDEEDSIVPLAPVYGIIFDSSSWADRKPSEGDALVFSVTDCGVGDDPVDFTIEAVSASGATASIPLSECITLPRPLVVRMTKVDFVEKRFIARPAEDVFQTIEIPLTAFVDENPGFDPGGLRRIRFRFDRTDEGAVMIDRIGLCRAAQPDDPEML